MAAPHIRVEMSDAMGLMGSLVDGVSPRSVAVVTRQTATDLKKRLMVLTPVRWTGNTRRAWKINPTKKGHTVINRTRAARFLEEGTPAHGPKTAPRMFIPLNRRAHMAYKSGRRTGLRYGKDYRLAKFVNGVRPHRIVGRSIPFANALLAKHSRAHINKLLRRRKTY